MAKKRSPRLGQITFRLPEEMHRDLLEASQLLSMDLTTIIVQLVSEGLPAVIVQATERAKVLNTVRKELASLMQQFPPNVREELQKLLGLQPSD